MRFLPYFFLAFISACGTTSVNNTPAEQLTIQALESYLFEIEGEENIPFSGYVNLDEFKKRGPGGGTYYAGYSAASFLVSVIAHAAVSSSVDSNKMKQFISETNESTLGEIQNLVSNYNKNILLDRFESSLLNSAKYNTEFAITIEDNTLPKGYITSNPEFIITKEHDMIILQNDFSILRNEDKNDATQKKSKSIIYLSDKIEDPAVIFDKGNSDRFEALTSEIFLKTVHLFDQHHTEKKENTLKTETIKFYIGEHFRVERGKVINKSCNRVTFLTLRGSIKSVPQNQCSGEIQAPS